MAGGGYNGDNSNRLAGVPYKTSSGRIFGDGIVVDHDPAKTGRHRCLHNATDQVHEVSIERVVVPLHSRFRTMRDMKYILTLWTIVLGTPCLSQAPDFLPQEDLIAWYAMGAGSMEESGLVPLQPVVFAEDRFGEADECILFDEEQELTTAGLSYSDFTISFLPHEASSEDVCHGLISQNTGVERTPLMQRGGMQHSTGHSLPSEDHQLCGRPSGAELNVLSWQHLVFQRQGNTNSDVLERRPGRGRRV